MLLGTEMAKALTIDGRELGDLPIELLRERIADVRPVDRSEVWLNDSAGPALCILKSGTRALLMYLRCEGDVGLTSRSRGDHDDGDLEFTLANGQVDLYPSEWTVAFEDAARAAEHFWLEAKPAPFVSWHDDSDPPSE